MADEIEISIGAKEKSSSAADAAPQAPDEQVTGEEEDVLDLVRQRLDLPDDVSDMTIASSLALIAGRSDDRGRWLAAFASPVGRRLAARGRDLDPALASLVALAQSRLS